MDLSTGGLNVHVSPPRTSSDGEGTWEEGRVRYTVQPDIGISQTKVWVGGEDFPRVQVEGKRWGEGWRLKVRWKGVWRVDIITSKEDEEVGGPAGEVPAEVTALGVGKGLIGVVVTGVVAAGVVATDFTASSFFLLACPNPKSLSPPPRLFNTNP